ncbi:helix-turn-helix domain-containing protein [Duganella sp. FT50W]|uniref:Helix-turn-helix domain-containing protein n=1 Tax=Duganella lactea TaxID=2692173 RepID=A0A6L8MT39_9BURK|nr:helix-turn-helix domain-containing protein [Duganella lactea]
MEPAEAFGRALRSRRLKVSMSQERLALEAGLERVFISWLENGHKQPTFQTILKLAAALNCHASELVADAEALLIANT